MKFLTFSKVYLDKPILDYAGQPYLFEGKPMTVRRFIDMVSALPNREFVHAKLSRDEKIGSETRFQIDETLANEVRELDAVDDPHGLLAVGMQDFFKPYVQRVDGD